MSLSPLPITEMFDFRRQTQATYSPRIIATSSCRQPSFAPADIAVLIQ